MLFIHIVGVDGQSTVTIVSNPHGTSVSGSTNTYYSILSNVTLTCTVTSSDRLTTAMTSYEWKTTKCFANDKYKNPMCFPSGQKMQNVTISNLLAKDTSTITCSANDSLPSLPLKLHISGIHIDKCIYQESKDVYITIITVWL